MVIERKWAMPNKWTFKIKPINELLEKYVGDGEGWIDPFAGENSPAEITNDLNPKRPTKFHLKATHFVEMLPEKYRGVLFDPPYSLRQTKECYEGVGMKFSQKDSQEAVHWGRLKTQIASKIIKGGIAITFGWNSSGFGKKRGFEKVEILMVNHGGNGHHDTICTVERKII